MSNLGPNKVFIRFKGGVWEFNLGGGARDWRQTALNNPDRAGIDAMLANHAYLWFGPNASFDIIDQTQGASQ